MDNKVSFEIVLSKIKEFMILEENKDYIVDLILASAVSLELDKPVWLMIIAPPSSGKTELINILSKLKRFHPIYNITTRTLFSGHPSAQGGYIPREVKRKGILVFPDFTTVLSMNSKAKKEIFNQLRVIYDGKAGLLTGIDTTKTKAWEGKVAIITSVTESIESVIENASDLGERFLYYRFNPLKITFEKMESFNSNESAKEDVKLLVKELLESKNVETNKIIIDEKDKNSIFLLANFICICRTKVDRSGYSREIVQVHTPEQPYRLVTALTTLYKSLIYINGNKERSIKIIKHVAFDSISSLRTLIIVNLTERKKSFHNIKDKINGISESKVRRTLEDLIILKIVIEESTPIKNSKIYSLNTDFLQIVEVFR